MIALLHRRALVGAAICCAPVLSALAQSPASSVSTHVATALASPEFQPGAATAAPCLAFAAPSASAPLLAEASETAEVAPELLAAASLPRPGTGAPPPVSPLQRLKGARSGPVTISGPITTSSDRATARASGLITLTGNVDVHMGDRELQGQQMTYDRNTNAFSVTGMVRFSDPTVRIEGDSGHYSDLGAQFTHAQFQFLTHPGRGRAQDLSMTPTHVITLSNLFYTSCPRDHTDWDIRARQMRLDTAISRGVARGAIVDFKGVPIIYVPYLSFPLSSARQSGLLFPLFGTSSRDGAIIGVPWYWNIAPNQDATFTPTEYSTRGPDLGVEYRYLSHDDSGTFDGDYLPYDSQTHTERSYLKLLDQLNLPDNSRLLADLESVSDDAYFEDFTQGVQSTATAFLPRSLSLIHRDDIWTLGIQSLGYQTIDSTLPLDEHPYEESPRLTASANWSPASLPWLRTGFDSEVANFSRSSCVLAYCLSAVAANAADFAADFPDGVSVSGWRLDARPQIGADFSAPGYFFRPTVAWELTQYELRDVTSGAAQFASIPAAPGALQGLQTYAAPDMGPYLPYGLPGMPAFDPAAAYAGAAYGPSRYGLPPYYQFTAAGAADAFTYTNASPGRNLPIVTLDSGLTFDRLAGAQGGQTVTLEPRVLYVYIPYRDQNDLPLFDTGIPDPNLIELFRANRYVGVDRIGDANEFTVGLTSELFSTATGTRYITATLGQSLYLTAPQVTLPGETIDPDRSNLIGEINVAAYHDWNTLLDIASNAAVTRIEEAEGELQYRRNGTEVLNFGYQYYQGLFQQVDTSAAWPVLSHWDLYGRLVYSLLGGTAIEEFAGFQYHGACWGVRAVWQSSLATRYGARDTGVSVQLELTGLSNVGSQVDTFLEQQIRGYSTTPNGRVLNTPFAP